MGKLYDMIFGKPKQGLYKPSFETFTESSPQFTPYTRGIYGQEQTRSAIHRFATACSTLTPEIEGHAHPGIRRAFETWPNDKQTWPQFLYRLATIYECDATAYVVKVFAPDNQTVIGLWPVKCAFADIVSVGGEPWVQFHFKNGPDGFMELSNTFIFTKYQYESDFFGTGNCLDDTMKLIHAQSEAQTHAIKNGAKIRFIGALNSQVRPEDLRKKREEFVENNLGNDNEDGLLLYDQTFQNVVQVDPKSYTIDSGEMERINDNVYEYFGTNKDIQVNSNDEDTWGAYYEGKVEPWAVQLGEGLSKLLFTQRERRTNCVSFSSSRLQYASNASKRNMVRDMVDRGIITINEGREILQLPKVKGGDVFVIRGEYKSANESASDNDEKPKDVDEVKDDTDQEDGDIND